MLRAELASLVAASVDRLIASGELPEAARLPVEIIDTKDPAHGDFATNFALVAAKPCGMNPRAVAEKLVSVLSGGLIESVEIAGPGFLNFRLKPAAVAAHLPGLLSEGEGFVKGSPAAPLKINVEFVSVNPNGPITVGSGRGAAFGDTLSRVLEAAGHTVNREYYINDGVNSEQMRQFGRALKLATLTKVDPVISKSYQAMQKAWDDVIDLMVKLSPMENKAEVRSIAEREFANAIPIVRISRRFAEFIGPGNKSESEHWFKEKARQFGEALKNSEEEDEKDLYTIFFVEFPDVFTTPELLKQMYLNWMEEGGSNRLMYAGSFVESLSQRVSGDPDLNNQSSDSWYQQVGQELVISRQKEDLDIFGVRFDTWFTEQSLHNSGEVARKIEELESKGAADTEEHRTKIKFGRNGTIEEVTTESQAKDDDEELGAGNSELGTDGGKTLWLRSTKFGDDMDRVLRRRDGRLTYIASDVAYHADKFNRPPNADKLITVLGPDHHGYIGRLHAVLAALLLDKSDRSDKSDSLLTEEEAKIYSSPIERDACLAALEEARKKLEVIIFQIVRFVKDGQPAPMRKRDGNIYELRDLINELGAAQAPNASKEDQQRIGADVARFFYLMRSHDTHMDFDIDLATKQSDENPVFYVQYAHARICSVLAKAQESIEVLKSWSIEEPLPSFAASLLTHPRELALIKKILDLPEEVQRCAKDYGVHRLTTYSIELARSFHHFYDACRVVQPDQSELSLARVALCQAARVGLKSALSLLGVSAPERMERAESPS